MDKGSRVMMIIITILCVFLLVVGSIDVAGTIDLALLDPQFPCFGGVCETRVGLETSNLLAGMIFGFLMLCVALYSFRIAPSEAII